LRGEGGFPTPRAQFINNGFWLGEFFGQKRANGAGSATLASREIIQVETSVPPQLAIFRFALPRHL